MPSLEEDRPVDVADEIPEPGPSPEEIEREAYETGFAAGQKAGFEMGDQRAAVLLSKLEGIIRETEQYRERILSDIEPQMLGLASGIAKKIILVELDVKPEVTVNIVREAIRKLERTGPIVIKLNQSVQDLFMRLKPELLEVHPDIIFDIDPSLPPTGQIVIGESEEVVTDLDSQIGNIIEDMGGKSGGY